MAKTLTIEVAPQIHPILERLRGETPSQKIAFLISNELRRYLEECEREMLELEIKYGLDYEQFKEKLEKGELGDEFSYELEKDAMRWEDLIAEKKLGKGDRGAPPMTIAEFRERLSTAVKKHFPEANLEARER